MIGHTTLIQILNLWTELETSLQGKNRHAFDTAEIYLHTLDLYVQFGPSAEARQSRSKSALKTLKELCMLFQNLHRGSLVEIEQDGQEFVEAKAFIVTNGAGTRTRYRVKVTKGEGEE